MTDFKHGVLYPIKLMPMDGTDFLLFDDGIWKIGCWWEPYNDYGPRVATIKNPTHFMPLPNPPEDL